MFAKVVQNYIINLATIIAISHDTLLNLINRNIKRKIQFNLAHKETSSLSYNYK